MVEQTVDDFWNGKSTLGGGKVVIVGKESDPCVSSRRRGISAGRAVADSFYFSSVDFQGGAEHPGDAQ